ncbi:chemotaxis-specific protein-glutamate methyltransferase CheB [Paenibacillus sp. HJL G12]|uniref:Protein-glutamate methylesterase/protein-glutamine glutaminase n=1 Tax=Paenibacillus dendrobii TaxID=2691084 RepID=A0A7X3IJ34_9BACL|nr:chemotaxis response regulator protein-glutamate methylesterase [Paenibacillus dendrobii]MWV43530.1 chemotaxis-specific protein-glutamate methyltransferase CheB [Paenibacillus dendrobii]
MTPYKVVVVDDSAFMRKIFSDLIEKDPAFQVIDTAVNGREAVEKITRLKPDVVTMDVEMPEMNGLEALKLIMAEDPLPVIMLSGINEEGMKETIIALESGAFDFIRKPSLTYSQHIEQVGDALLEQLKAAMNARERRAAFRAEEEKRKQQKKESVQPLPSPSSVLKANVSKAGRTKAEPAKRLTPLPKKSEPLVKKKESQLLAKQEKSALHLPNPKREVAAAEEFIAPAAPASTGIPAAGIERDAFQHIVAIGCSTGGPRALKAVLEKIPADLPAPVVIVQHMPPNFTKSLAQRLNSFSPLEVLEAEHGMALKAGVAYIAPGGKHMRVSQGSGGRYSLILSDDEPLNGHKPSVDVLFESLLPLTSLRRHAVLMTGMGSDGARMMKRLYDSGVSSTFAESEETCIVYGMPRSAVELNCVSHVLPLQEIAVGVTRAVK